MHVHSFRLSTATQHHTLSVCREEVAADSNTYLEMTMEHKPFVVNPSEQPQPLNVVGEHITVLAGGDETGGYEMFLQRGPEGSGPPPHSHPWDESFYITRGQVQFGLGEEMYAGQAGTLVHIPAGTVHWFRFGQEGGEMLSVTSRLAASRLFREIDHNISPEAPDMARLFEIAERHSTRVHV
jgi:quercetin dioxygenase-like cupin family protein